MPHLSQIQIEAAENDLYAYQESHFVGSARVELSCLSFDMRPYRQMDDRENTRRLEKIFKIQGCFRLRQENHVPVLISMEDRHRVRFLEDPAEPLPKLDVDTDYSLQTEDHESLIDAARQTLEAGSQWWIADVYVTRAAGKVMYARFADRNIGFL